MPAAEFGPHPVLHLTPDNLQAPGSRWRAFPPEMLFKSRLCDICNNTLRIAFDSTDDRVSDAIPHHLTKASLVDSVLRRSCHLCRLIIFHFRLYWSFQHRNGKDDLKEEPTTLQEEDFKDSDFDFATFPSDRKTLYSYMLELDEELGLHAQIKTYGDGANGTYGIVQFDSKGYDSDPPRFWIFDERAFGAPPVTSRLNDSTAATTSQDVVKMWLEQCSDHEECSSQQQGFLPTRLLKISDVDRTNKVCLVLSEDLDKATRYVTLSHCWGEGLSFLLVKESLENMLDGFKLENMPKTFREAIAVARWAHIDYIWIDSCCIIQDSTADWEKEAKMMHEVYKHTYFNISADHSENSHGGCFVDRLAYKITPVPYNSSKKGHVYLVPRFDLTRPLVDSPISERAWVSQERYLSPRILHFTTDQIFWECAGLFACETFPKGMPSVYDDSTSQHYRASLDRLLTNNEDETKIYRIWNRVCQDYSRAKLTRISDRIIAFAGIAQEFRSRLPNDIYLAGLWRGDIVNGLLWKVAALDGWPTQPNGSHELYADPYITASIPETYRAPSWSWLGKNCGIIAQTREHIQPQHLMNMLEERVDLVDTKEPVGDIQSGYLKVRGCLRAAQWKQDGLIDSIILDGKSGDQLRTTSEPPTDTKLDLFTLQRDTGTEFPLKDIFCFPVRMCTSSEGPSHNIKTIEGLVLGPTGEKNEYRRLGHFEAVGVGHCRALRFELLPPAKELSQPWKSLIPGIVDGGDDGNQYDDEYFEEVKECVFTII